MEQAIQRTGTVGDIAQECGVTSARVGQWSRDFPDFPEPLREGRAGRQYDLDAVKAWAKEHGYGKA